MHPVQVPTHTKTHTYTPLIHHKEKARAAVLPRGAVQGATTNFEYTHKQKVRTVLRSVWN